MVSGEGMSTLGRRYPTERREKPETGEKGGRGGGGWADPVTRGEMLKTCPLIMTHLCSKRELQEIFVLQDIFKPCALITTGLRDRGVGDRGDGERLASSRSCKHTASASQ